MTGKLSSQNLRERRQGSQQGGTAHSDQVTYSGHQQHNGMSFKFTLALKSTRFLKKFLI